MLRRSTALKLFFCVLAIVLAPIYWWWQSRPPEAAVSARTAPSEPADAAPFPSVSSSEPTAAITEPDAAIGESPTPGSPDVVDSPAIDGFFERRTVVEAQLGAGEVTHVENVATAASLSIYPCDYQDHRVTVLERRPNDAQEPQDDGYNGYGVGFQLGDGERISTVTLVLHAKNTVQAGANSFIRVRFELTTRCPAATKDR